jgi:hypothetical protein
VSRATLHDELMEAAGFAPAPVTRRRGLHAAVSRSSLRLRFALFAALVVVLMFVPWIRSLGFGWDDAVVAIVLAAGGLVVHDQRRVPPKKDST